MFSPTFIIGNSARCWNTIFTFRRFGGRRTTELPRMRMSPAVGSSKPAIIRISVVLPEPDGPRIEKNEPAGICSETSSTAVKGPNRLVRLTHSRSYIPPDDRRERKGPVGPFPCMASSLGGSGLDSLQRLALHVFDPGRNVRKEFQ